VFVPLINERKFKFFLARELSMSVARLEQEVSPEELEGWRDFYRYQRQMTQGPVPPPKAAEGAEMAAEAGT
jgi:hypothetical protein